MTEVENWRKRPILPGRAGKEDVYGFSLLHKNAVWCEKVSTKAPFKEKGLGSF